MDHKRYLASTLVPSADADGTDVDTTYPISFELSLMASRRMP